MSHWLKVEGYILEHCPLPAPTHKPPVNASPRPFSANLLAALERGRVARDRVVELYKFGSTEEIAKDLWLRGATIRIDIIRARAFVAARTEAESGGELR